MLKQDDFINARERFILPKKKKVEEPKIDKEASLIVGHKVYTRDPRLFDTVIKFKSKKSVNSETPDNFYQDPRFREELRKAFSKEV